MNSILFFTCFFIGFLPTLTNNNKISHHHVSRCTGAANCNACTNCSRCKYCTSGGSCGVCSGGGYSNHSRTNVMRSNRQGSYQTKSQASLNPMKKVKHYKIKNLKPIKFNSDKNRNFALVKLNLRQKPSVKSSIIGLVEPLGELKVLSESNHWCKVEIIKTGQIGYLFKKYVD